MLGFQCRPGELRWHVNEVYSSYWEVEGQELPQKRELESQEEEVYRIALVIKILFLV